MLQFVVRGDGSEVVRSFVCAQMPFRIGRASTADFQLSAPGVWDQHAEIVRESSGKLLLRPVGEAILLVNGARCEERLLVPGDEVQLGAASLVVGLPPIEQRGLATSEIIAWVLLATVLAGEIYAFFQAG